MTSNADYLGFVFAGLPCAGRAFEVSEASMLLSRERNRGAAKSRSARNLSGNAPRPEYKKLTGIGAGSKSCNSRLSWPARTAGSA
jgi:hypothetical protein